MKRRLRILKLLALFAILAALAVWLEPTRVVWGWLRGDAFYDGRPTRYWRAEISRWEDDFAIMVGIPRIELRLNPDEQIAIDPTVKSPIFGDQMVWNTWSRKPTWLEKALGHVFPAVLKNDRTQPPLLDGDPLAEQVLLELDEDDNANIRLIARRGLEAIAHKQLNVLERIEK